MPKVKKKTMPKVKKKTMPKVKNPQVFMEISIDSGEAKRITFELFANVVPKTAENFRALCTGERGLGAITQKPLSFKGTEFHRIIPGFIAQGGDFSKGNGLGGESIYGGIFPDESFKLKHDECGLLSMANSGPHTNGSQFFITFEATPTLDNLHVVFGKVISGLELLKLVEEAGSPDGVPPSPVLIVDCGEVSSDTKRSRKRKHCSSDSYISDTSDSRSYSSDCVSKSELYSSSSIDTNSSSIPVIIGIREEDGLRRINANPQRGMVNIQRGGGSLEDQKGNQDGAMGVQVKTWKAQRQRAAVLIVKAQAILQNLRCQKLRVKRIPVHAVMQVARITAAAALLPTEEGPSPCRRA